MQDCDKKCAKKLHKKERVKKERVKKKRAGRSAADRMLRKHEAAGAIPARSTIAFQTFTFQAYQKSWEKEGLKFF